jgi:hypothetical protein
MYHFPNTFLFGEEEGDSQNPQVLPDEKRQEDIRSTWSNMSLGKSVFL